MAKKNSKQVKKVLYVSIFALIMVGSLYTIGFGSSNFSGDLFSLVAQQGVVCKVWNTPIEVGVNGEEKFWGYHTTPDFNPSIVFDVASLSSSVGTDKEIRNESFIACEATSSTVFPFLLTGGTVTIDYSVDDADGKHYNIGSDSKTISAIAERATRTSTAVTGIDLIVDDIDAQGVGVKLATFVLDAKDIDDVLTSTDPNYIAKVRMNITFLPTFSAFNQPHTAGVFLNQALAVKINNEIIDPPTPISSDVKITSFEHDFKRYDNSPSSGTLDVKDMTDDGQTNVTFKTRVQLPQWKETEGVPTISIVKKTDSGETINVATNVPITIKRLVNGNDNTYEFTNTLSVSLTTLQHDGSGIYQFDVESNQNVRKQSDTFTLSVVNTSPENPQCGLGMQFSDGKCVPLCNEDSTLVDNKCVPITNDHKNCLVDGKTIVIPKTDDCPKEGIGGTGVDIDDLNGLLQTGMLYIIGFLVFLIIIAILISVARSRVKMVTG